MPFILPLAYLVIAGAAWSVTFRKKFSASLAPAVMLHIVLLLLAGMLCHSLSAGILIGCLLYIAMLAFYLVSGRSVLAVFSSGRNRSSREEREQACSKASVLSGMCSYARRLLADSGFRLFLFFYLFCWLTNIDKQFLAWDEFAHWGMFVKESLRLDDLFALSPLPFSHKDYVPAVTLFEVLWIQLCGQYTEPDVYRAIQMLMFIMMLPMFRAFESVPADASCRFPGVQHTGGNLYEKAALSAAVLAVLLLPLIFNTSNAFFFYHSVYCDYLSGVLLFYCMMAACTDEGSACYRLVIFTLALTIMVLTKMTLMVFLPAVILFFLIRELWIREDRPAGKTMACLVFPLAVPVGFWFAFNKFVDQYVPNTGGIQSYDGMKLSSVLEVFKSSAESSIPYLEDVRRTFTDAVLYRDVLLHGSYAAAIGGIVAIMLLASWLVKDRQEKRTAYLATLWTLLTGIFYALVMYFLYETAFSEREARYLASYERYMNTFTVCAAMFALYVFYASSLWKKYRKALPAAVLALMSFVLIFGHVSAFSQVIPGFLTDDREKTRSLREMAEQINTVPERASIYELTRGENGWILVQLRYYCAPRALAGGSIGKKMYDGDVFTRNLTVEQFVKEAGKYDYLYVNSVDAPFMEQYSAAFRDPHIISNKALYKIEGASGGVLDLSCSNIRPVSLKDMTFLDEYLSRLQDSPYTVFVSVRDEGSRYITPERQELLNKLGAALDLRGQWRKSYYAVVKNGVLIAEQLGNGLISACGTLESGASYSVKSQGWIAGNSVSSIVINGKELSKNRRGLNIVVYDEAAGKVVDSVCFDTFAGGLCYR